VEEIPQKVFATREMKKNSNRIQFSAILEKPDDGMDTAFISIPFDVSEVFGTRGQVKVNAWFDGEPYRGILANMGTGCHVIIVRKDVRSAIGKKVGDRVQVEIEQDKTERTVEVPAAMNKALKKNASARKFFESLSYTNRKEYVNWIVDAKKEETKEKRLGLLVEKLAAGKKNPTEK